MAAWTWADIVSQAKEWTLVAIGEKALTAQEEERIRKETESAIIRAGGGPSEVKQANAEITSVIQQNQREQVRLRDLPSKISSVAGDLIGDPKILFLLGAGIVLFFYFRKR
ncbi:MAG: hypothetical protein ACREA9_29020 [Pyrinomonadaceae bacterium]